MINEKIIEQVMQIHYLQIRLTSTNREDTEIRHQLTKEKRTGVYMNMDIIWNNKYLVKYAQNMV